MLPLENFCSSAYRAGMLDVTILASGSAGNATLVRSGDTRILVDAGLSARQLALRIQSCGVEPSALDAILLTHEHSDHSGALPVLLARHKIPIYCNAQTARAVRNAKWPAACEWQLFTNGQTFNIKEISIRPFAVPHDAADPVGFRIAAGGAHFGILTDLGYPTRLVFEALHGIHGLFIETNHDEQLLQRDTKRPWSVKQRITSRHGHLSNAAAARVVAELASPSLKTVILGHLSRDCNTPDLACQAVLAELARIGRTDVTVHCSGQSEPTPAFSLRRIFPDSEKDSSFSSML